MLAYALLMLSFLRACCLKVVCLLPAAAFAHGDVNTQPWLEGMLHLITSPMSIALLLGLALVALGLDEQQHYSVSAMAGVGALGTLLLGHWLGLQANSSGARAASAGIAALLGSFAAIGWAVPRRWMMGLALGAGAASSFAAELDRFHWQSVLSLALTLIVLCSLLNVGLRDVRRVPWVAKHLPLAARIAGAWIACLGLLLLALALKASPP